MIAESPAYGPDAKAVIRGRYKLVERSDGVVRLFDLSEDPRELSDLSTEHPHVVAELRGLLRSQTEQITAKGAKARLDPEIANDLRTLGYLD
jgi:hypothetical protein